MALVVGVEGMGSGEPLPGHQHKQRCGGMLGGTLNLTSGSVHQSLMLLERDWLGPPTGDRGDRGREAYCTTVAGVSALKEWLEDPDSQPQLLRDEVYVKLLLLGRHHNGQLERLLNRQRHVYLQRMRDLADQEKVARERGRPQLALLFKGGQFHTEAELKFLDAVVEGMGRD